MIPREHILDLWELGAILTNEIFLPCPVYSILGMHYVIDYTGFKGSTSLDLVKHPSRLSFICRIFSLYPVKVKQFHLVNFPKGLRGILTLCKSFMSVKMRRRVKIHPTLESLHKEIPLSHLPDVLEGTYGEFSIMTGILFYSTLIKFRQA